MMNMTKKIWAAAFASCVIAAGVFAGEEGGSPLFRRARDFYAAEQYDSTIVLIRDHLRRVPRDPESITLVPLVTEAYMRKGDHAQALRLIERYMQMFPESSFLPRMHYLEGVAYGREAKPIQGLTSFSRALELGVSAELFNQALIGADNICGRSLSADELSSISGRGELHPALLEAVRYHEAVKLAEAGQTVRARNSAEEFRNTYPRSRYTEQIKELIARLSKERGRGTGPVQIGLLAPMSGEDAEVGQYILQGVKLAIDSYNARTQNPIKLIVYDTRGSPVETARRSKDLLKKDQAQICIGPVLSNTAVVSAAMFSGKDIVMMTPTANEDGISALDDNIFQMNVTIGTIARRLARYALEQLNIREFAILAPNNAFGHAMAEAFKEELSRHSIEVVHEEYFNEGTNDFTRVLRRLHSALLGRKLEARAAERGDMQRGRQLTRSDSIRYSDSIMTVGGLFMPILDYEDVVKLVPQTVFHRIRGQMLGAGGWYDSRVISEGRRHVNNAVIAVGMQPDLASEDWKNFSAAYRARYNADANRISAMGYDAAQIIIKAVEETGGHDTERLQKAISSVQEYGGLSGRISIDSTGANSEAIIMKITETGFMRVQ